MKRFLNMRSIATGSLVVAAVAFWGFKSGDDRNFQVAKIYSIP